jgi:rubrerythrin
MPEDLMIDEVDRDGAVAEAREGLKDHTRAGLFRRIGLVAGGGLVAGAVPLTMATGQSGGLSKRDVEILNYALTLEFLEAAFYEEANSKGALSGEYARFSQVVFEHEDAHVKALQETLGDKAVKKPSFDFKGTTESQDTFAQTAITLEDTGVKAYQGQAGAIKTPAVLDAAISIHPVEARHAAWIRSIVGQGSGQPSPAPDAFNPAADMATVLAAVKQTGFLAAMDSAASGGAVSGQPAVGG